MKKEVKLPDYQMDKVNWFGGGDADVCTKDGRRTSVNVIVNRLRVSPDNNYVLAQITYNIKEMRSNFTQLKSVDTVEIPIPYECVGKKVKIVDTTDFSYSNVFLGKNHDWNSISAPYPTSIVQSGELKFDGPGRDDRGNASLKLVLRAWVEIT
jgi:hypothetical protein